MRVRVYYNLHKHTFSIQHHIDGRWLVRDYADEVRLRDVVFKVSEAGRRRVLAEGRKNVHAFVIGTLVDDLPDTPTKVMYNPRTQSTFIEKETQRPVHSAEYARLINKQVLVA
jgi:hypothetical protein